MNIQDNKRILSVDLGEKRTGIAVSDDSLFISTGLESISVPGLEKLCAEIIRIAEKEKCFLVVIGNPLNMDGSESRKTDIAKRVSAKIELSSNLRSVIYDERCTTTEAHEYLNMTNRRGKKRKSVVDALSAQIILQDYLDNVVRADPEKTDEKISEYRNIYAEVNK